MSKDINGRGGAAHAHGSLAARKTEEKMAALVTCRASIDYLGIPWVQFPAVVTKIQQKVRSVMETFTLTAARLQRPNGGAPQASSY